MTPHSAEIFALEALAWMAQDEDVLSLFLNASGSSVADLKAQAQSSEFLLAVLDFILLEDQWVLDCAEACHCDPNMIAMARQALPGGEIVHWT